MNEIKIGIIDDDSSKVTQLMTWLQEGWENASPEKRVKYSAYSIVPVEIKLLPTIDETHGEIISLKADCMLIDYRLSSFATVAFSGTDLAKALTTVHFGFPIFILTAYEDEIYAKEVFDVYQIFNFDRYVNDMEERLELNTKIIEQVLKYRKEFASWEQELSELLPRVGENAKIDARIIQLDGYIERSLNGTNAIPDNIKKQLSDGKIDALLDKLDKLIKQR